MARVLLIDDEPLVRKVTKVMLEGEGHDVLEASNSGEGFDSVVRDNPDVVVLDLMMPGEDGLSLCRRIKTERANTRVLLLTSLSGQDSREGADEAGADEYMEKPFAPLELIETVARLAGA